MITLTRALVLVATLVTGVVVTACDGSVPTPDEIVEKSRAHAIAANSYAAFTTHYFDPESEEASGTQDIQVERPGNYRYPGTDDSTEIILVGDTAFRPVESKPGKWLRATVENA
ncbi:MAG: hypothetical protein QF357_07800 [Dehalococcoidia bacterium]|nr:hypothetical protein [Dehalococcoidia bacterium]